jgi:hypothetical protein
VSDRLRAQVAVEREQLNRLLAAHRPLLAKCAAQAPDTIERSALAAMLHSFYTGIEHIFKRVAVECDGGPPVGDVWHRALLAGMTKPSSRRPAVISENTAQALRAYLDFRHVFRHAYSFELQWEKMAPLVRQCEKTLVRLESELDTFLASLDRNGKSA